MPKSQHQLDGIEILFHFNDHEPPHFHARKAGCWGLKVYFKVSNDKHLEFEVKWKLKGGPNRKDLQRLREYIVKNRDVLEFEWEKFVCER